MRSEYRVLTPESVEFAYELGGLGSRMLAALVDYLIMGALWLLAWMVGLLAAMFTGGLGMFAGFVLAFAVWFGYFAVLEWRWNGQTVGKRMLDLRVIDERGFSIDLFQSFTRNLLRLADIMPFFYAVGGISALCNPRQKRLGDFAAGTLVVRVRRRPMPAAVMAPSEKYNTLQEDAGLRARVRARLSLPERDLLLQLCIRRHELAIETRRALFDETAAHLENQLEVTREPYLSAEKFVQNIAAIALAEGPARLPARAG